MGKISKDILLSHIAAAALATGLMVPGTAMAQTSGTTAREGGGLADILVTAQRREESLQAVPVAVTALGTDQLDQMRVTDVQNLSGLAPNLNVATQGVQSIPVISIRGINSGTSENSVDPKIGLYLDGVYIGRSVGAIFDLADIERVEVLRGPQGTLFGRNATGGAISLVSSKPSGELGLKAMASYGNQNSWRLRTVVDLPQFGPLALKFSYLHDESHGWGRNLIGGQTIDLSLREPSFGKLTYADHLGSKNVNAFQAAARLDFGGDILIDYHFDYTDSKTTAGPVQVLGHNGDLKGITELIFDLQPLYGGITNQSIAPLSAVANATSVQHMTVEGHNLTLSWDVSDNLSLKSITGYRRFKQKPNAHDLSGSGGLHFTAAQLAGLLTGDIGAVFDPANAPGPNDHFFTLLSARSTRQKQFTEEIQAVLTTDRFDLTAGGFYFRERSPSLSVLGIMQPAPNGQVVPTPFDTVFGSGVNETIAINSSLAGYAQGTFHASDQFDISLGARYTHDKREMELVRIGATGVGSSGILPPGTHTKNFNQLTYTAIATYRPNSDITTYAKIARGYVAGGVLNAVPFGPEKITSYEIGLKSELFDRRLRANFAGYYMNYNDMQIYTFENGVQRLENAGKARTWGIEAELTAAPIDGLNLEANLGYQNFKYKEYMSTAIGGVLSNVAHLARQTYSPAWNIRLAGQYDFPEFASGGHVMVRLDGRYRSEVDLGTFPPDTAELNALTISRAHWMVDGRIGVVEIPLKGAEVGVSLWGKNLFNIQDVAMFGPNAIVQTIDYINGRTYGVEVNFKF